MLATPDRLSAWYEESGIVDAVSPAREADVEQARTVREAMYRLVTARPPARGRVRQGGADRGEQRGTQAVRGTAAHSGGARWTQAAPEEALSMVARHAIELLSGSDVPLLKECGNPECTRTYIDRSRGMRRQWCGMESCGNKIKAAAYRARRKTAPAPC